MDLFTEENGNPLVVWLAAQVEDRLGLADLMQTHGAIVTENIEDCTIGLVNLSDQPALLETMRLWGQVKPLVDSQWAVAALNDPNNAPELTNYLCNMELLTDGAIEEEAHETSDVQNGQQLPVPLLQEFDHSIPGLANGHHPPELNHHNHSPSSQSTLVAQPPLDHQLSLSPLSPTPSPEPGLLPFINANNQSLKFYVQIQIKTRNQLREILQKNGGALVSGMGQADYVVLSRSEKEFEHLLPMVPPGKPVVSPAWIHACDEAGIRVDVYQYLENAAALAAANVSPASPTKKRKLVSTPASAAKATTSQVNAVDIESVAPPPKRRKKSRVSSAGPTNASASVSYASGPVDARRSPTPPTTVIKHVRGYTFTDQDNEFILKSVRIALERDPTASKNKITTWMQKKAPHHSSLSWDTHLRKRFPNLYDDTRNEMMAKRYQAAPQAVPAPEPAPVLAPAAPVRPLLAPAAPVASAPRAPAAASTSSGVNFTSDLQASVERVARWLFKAQKRGMSPENALMAMDMQEDDACKFAPSWEVFYEIFQLKINEAMATL